jgi:hypothetical protein
MERKMTKSFHELYTEIAHYVESLQWVMVEAHEQGCSLLLLVDASTNPAVPMPAVRIVHEDQAVWCGAWHQALTATPASAWAAAATRRAKGGDVTSPERNK